MTRQEMIAKLRRLHTLLIIEKRSNNLAIALRRAIQFIGSWKESPDVVSAKISTRRLFAGYGPKFFRIYDEILKTGTCWMIEELQPRHNPFFCALCEIPSIGVGMAQRMYYDRSICTPEDLQIAYSNRILEKIPAFGEQRLKAVESWLMHPPESYFEAERPEEEGQNNAETGDRTRRNAKIFQSSVFHAIGGYDNILQNGDKSSHPRQTRLEFDGGVSARVDEKRPNEDRNGTFEGEIRTDDASTDHGGATSADAESPVDIDSDDDLHALTDPNIDDESELRNLGDYPEWQAKKRNSRQSTNAQPVVMGRAARVEHSPTIHGDDSIDIARDLQNQSICCSKFACANLQADKIIAQRIFVHTIQCDKLIADSLTRLSKAQWEQRKQTRDDNSDAWEGVQTNNVLTNEIDADTIQANDVVAHRIYCVVCDCPVKRVDSQI